MSKSLKKYNFLKTKNSFSKKQWAKVKKTVGWKKFSSPSIIIKDGHTKTTSKEIADSLNVNMIKKNIRIFRDIPKTEVNPLENYKKLVQGKKPNFKIEHISMSTLRKTLNNMKATPSTGIDQISMKTIKKLQKTLEASLLNLINTTIGTTEYPQSLKKAKLYHYSNRENQRIYHLATEELIYSQLLGN